MNNYERDIRKIFAGIQKIFRVFPSLYFCIMDIWSYKIFALFFLFPVLWQTNIKVDKYGEISILYFICYSFIYLIFNKFHKKNCSIMADLGRPILVFFLLRSFVAIIGLAPNNWFCVLIFLIFLAFVLIDWKSPITQYDKYLFLVLLFTMPTITPRYINESQIVFGGIKSWGEAIVFFYNANYFKYVTTNNWYTWNFLTIVIDLIIFALVLFFKKRTARRLYKETTVESPTNSEKSIEKE